jgi:uncharacterized protein
VLCLKRVVLHVRTRGDARPDSDYDVAVFLRDLPDRITELYRLADLSTAILENAGEFIHAMAYPAGSYNSALTIMSACRLCTTSAPRASTCEGANQRAFLDKSRELLDEANAILRISS